MSETDLWCDHCGTWTRHLYHDGGHERDSSNDYQECRVCGYWMTGVSLEQHPPPRDEACSRRVEVMK